MKHESNSSSPPMSDEHMGKSHYKQLGIMMALSFVAMYVLMYAMVNALDNVVMNFNQVYMAGLMAAHGAHRACSDARHV